ncbi:hypothetical protein M9H77_35537 [Catharanthus roseus]|uniref:Uncharacterized protein n=1 Tax=Catharanthus roseus TaxID=4058 RepID=A0ACB9ZTJ3_CATRO|nr:hypothetical protein M9H77_35537 [Catharanthus roseus]
MLGYKNENKLLSICLQLDVMTADEVRWVLCTGCRRFGLAGFPCDTAMYSCPSYPDSGGTQVAKQQDVHIKEYFLFRPFHRVPTWMITWVGTSPAVTRGYKIPGIFPVAFAYW